MLIGLIHCVAAVTNAVRLLGKELCLLGNRATRIHHEKYLD